MLSALRGHLMLLGAAVLWGCNAPMIKDLQGLGVPALVVADMLGMTKGFSPRFLRRYADLNTVMTDAIGNYVSDVKEGAFPNENESY